MKHSITYYLIMLIIRLKGFKKIFSKDPIDYLKLRKEDVHIPKAKLFAEYDIDNFKISKSLITEINQNESEKLLIFFHGGAFISGPGQHHWDSIKTILDHTNHNVWMCDYPKAPENKISEISDSIDDVYKEALARYSSNQITLIGDSVGGTLITALVQRQILACIDLPLKIILVSPVMDATMSNPDIMALDKIDPMLSRVGLLSAKKMCANDSNLDNVSLSPINGSFIGFPETICFLATKDITYSDQALAAKKLITSGTSVKVIEGADMPHVWPFLPVMKEAKLALNQIVNILNS